MKTVIIGYGQIGQGLHQTLSENVEGDKQEQFILVDPARKLYLGDKEQIGVLHICFPPDKDFPDQVQFYINHFTPDLVVIHSSVLPGTTRLISDKIVYSPIRGRHVRMASDISHYTKFVASVDIKQRHKAELYFRKHGLKTYVMDNPDELELFKLLDNLYYAWDLMFHDFIQESCDKVGGKLDHWQTFNRIYNQEVVKVPGRDTHTRSILKPPKGQLGGTCLWENAWLLKHLFSSQYLDFIINFDKVKLKKALAHEQGEEK